MQVVIDCIISFFSLLTYKYWLENCEKAVRGPYGNHCLENIFPGCSKEARLKAKTLR